MKHLLTCLLLSFFLSFSFGHAQSTFFASYGNNPGTGGWEEIVATSDQGFAMIQQGYYDAAILKVDANMNPVWSYNLDSMVSTSDLIETNDNHLLMAGVEGTTNAQVALLKFDLSGNLIFKKRVSYNPVGTALLRAFKIINAYDNGFLILGGECVGENLVIRLDKDGNVIWSNQYRDITQAGTATIYNGTKIGNNQYMLLSSNRTISNYIIDDNGTLISHTHYDNGNGQGYAKLLFETPSGNYIALGGLGNTDGWRDIWMTQFSPTGNLMWSKIATSSTLDTEEARGFSLNSSGGLTILSHGSQPVGTAPIPRYSYLMVSQFDLSGNFLSGTRALPPNSTYAGIGYEGFASANGGVYGVGWSGTDADDNFVNFIDGNGSGLCSSNNNPLSVNDISAGMLTTVDVVVVSPVPVVVLPVDWTLSPITFTPSVNCGNIATAVESPVEDLWHISPHPSQGETWLHHPVVQTGTAQVYDMAGRLIKSLDLTAGSTQTHLITSELSPGLYLIQAETEGEVHVERLIVR